MGTSPVEHVEHATPLFPANRPARQFVQFALDEL
jgi:hypothetical protein